MTCLQNVYEFQKLLIWQDDGPMEIERNSLPPEAPNHFPGHYARYDGVLVGVRPTKQGPVYFNGNKDVVLVHGHHTATVQRSDASVEFKLYDSETLVDEISYAPNEVEEFDPYEGTQSGLCEWIAEQLPKAAFYERLTG